MSRRSLLLPLLALTAAGCGDPLRIDRCAGVTCMGAAVCDPASGMCVGDAADMTRPVQDMTGADMTAPKPDMTMNMNMDLATADLAGNLMAACTSAADLKLVNNTVTVTGDTSALLNNTTSGCGGVTGPDLAYILTLAQPMSVDAVLTPDQNFPDFDPVLSIRTVCDSEMSQDEVTCNEIGPASVVTLSTILPAGTYYLWIDGYSGTSGGYSLTVTVSPPPPPPANENCAATEALPAFVNGKTSATGDLRSAVDDAAGQCGGTGGGDAVYSFTTTAPQSVTAVVTADMTSPNYVPVAYLRAACASALVPDELGCESGSAGATATAAAGYLPAGTYYVWVDSDGGGGGKFQLDVTLGAPGPMNDTCIGGAAPLTFVNNVATASIDTTVATQDVSSDGCGGVTGPDVVYSFTLAQAQKVTAKLVPDMGTASFDPVVAIRKVCNDNTSEVACGETGAGMTATAGGSLPAGTYFLWVDGYAGSSGKGVLTVTLSTAPSNESCAMPKAVTLGSMTADDTSGDSNDVGAAVSMACDYNGTGDFPGPDLVYSYTAAAAGMVKVTLASDGSWDPALYILPTTCMDDGSTCTQAIDVAGMAMPEVLTINAVAGTTYYIVVDSYSASAAGPFTLAVQ